MRSSDHVIINSSDHLNWISDQVGIEQGLNIYITHVMCVVCVHSVVRQKIGGVGSPTWGPGTTLICLLVALLGGVLCS